MRSEGGTIKHPDSMLWVADYTSVYAAKTPDKAALIYGDEVISYAQMDEQSDRFAAVLRELRLSPGDRLAYVGRNNALFFTVLFGSIRSGVIVVPLNWRCTAPEIRYMLQDCGATHVLADPDFLATVETAAADLEHPPAILLTEPDDSAAPSLRAMLAKPRAKPALPARDPDADCLILYTSGTTGHPKGVREQHRTLSLMRRSEEDSPAFADWTGEDIIVSAMPNFHVGGMSTVLIGFSRGLTTVLTANPAPDNILLLCRKYEATRTFMVPTVIRMLYELLKTDGSGLPHLKTIMYGAAPIGESFLRQLMALLDTGYMQMYGMTEICGTVTCLGPYDHDLTRPHLLHSVGKPLPGMMIEIRDPAGQPVPARTAGEIWIKTPTLTAGYWHKAQATQDAIVDGWYRSGDGGYLDEDGYLYLTDRIKDMIISGGENVYPAEVEDAMRQHPAVQEVAVIGVPDEKWGERVMAVIEVRPGFSPTEAELIEFARGRLAGYKLPRKISIIDALPRTASGKVQRAPLRAKYR